MIITEVRRPFVEGQCFPVFFWGDWHAGNANCAMESLVRDRYRIENTENAMYISMGDKGDFIAENDRRYNSKHLDRDVVGTSGSIIDNTILWLAEFESPVIEKCIASLDGNHEEVGNERNNTNVGIRQLHELGASELYCGRSALIRLMFIDQQGHTSWIGINAHHGKRTAKSKSTLLNAYMQKLRFWPNVHVLARGHCHFKGYDLESRTEVNSNWTQLKENIVWSVLTGGYLKGFQEGYDCYVESMDLDPMDIGFQQMNLYPSRKGMKVEMVAEGGSG